MKKFWKLKKLLYNKKIFIFIFFTFFVGTIFVFKNLIIRARTDYIVRILKNQYLDEINKNKIFFSSTDKESQKIKFNNQYLLLGEFFYQIKFKSIEEKLKNDEELYKNSEKFFIGWMLTYKQKCLMDFYFEKYFSEKYFFDFFYNIFWIQNDETQQAENFQILSKFFNELVYGLPFQPIKFDFNLLKMDKIVLAIDF